MYFAPVGFITNMNNIGAWAVGADNLGKTDSDLQQPCADPELRDWPKVGFAPNCSQ